MSGRTRLALIAGITLSLALAQSGQTTQADPFELFVWRSADPLFGGLSALEVSQDGARLTVVSDRGSWGSGTITRDAAGRIAAVAMPPMRILHGFGTAPLPEADRDTEGLAIAPDGTAYVSLEGNVRVLAYADLAGPAKILPIHRDFRRFRRNSGPEALAIAPDGTLYTLPEESRRPDQPFPVYRYRDGQWDQPFTIPRSGDFLASGADIGPDGRLYLLERAFHGIQGFASRVRRFTISGDTIDGGETLFETPTGRFDNLEGIAAWRDAQGRIVLTMVSDDNFFLLQRTELVEIRLPEDPAAPPFAPPSGQATLQLPD